MRGSDVAVVTVVPADAPPVRYKGHICIRVGSLRDLASRQDERILNERRLHHEQPFDLMPVRNATLEELALPYFAEVYLPGCVAPDVLAKNSRTVEEQLLATKMIAEEDVEYPTVTGLLVLGRRPRHFFPCAYVQFLRIGGVKLSDPIQDADEYDGPVDKLYERVMDKLRAFRTVAVVIAAGGERRTESISLVALEQLVANAIMHRTYEGTNAPIRITWFNDRVGIRSPGGP
jgi:ATP-dependent DNA helicase RecG